MIHQWISGFCYLFPMSQWHYKHNNIFTKGKNGRSWKPFMRIDWGFWLGATESTSPPSLFYSWIINPPVFRVTEKWPYQQTIKMELSMRFKALNISGKLVRNWYIDQYTRPRTIHRTKFINRISVQCNTSFRITAFLDFVHRPVL
jgi:hypothetical protein